MNESHSVQRPVGYVSQDFLDGKWSLDHIAKTDTGQISRVIPVFTRAQPSAEPAGYFHNTTADDDIAPRITTDGCPNHIKQEAEQRFVLGGDTVTDTQTGLIWSRQTVARDVTYSQAEEVVSTRLGKGWRLPTVSELFGLIDHSRHSPAIDVGVFEDTDSGWYWTSTQAAWNTASVWLATFHDGYVNIGPRYGSNCVRAVLDPMESNNG